MKEALDALREIIRELKKGNNVFMEIETDDILQHIQDAFTEEAEHRDMELKSFWAKEIVPLLSLEFDYTNERADQLKKIIFPNSIEW